MTYFKFGWKNKVHLCLVMRVLLWFSWHYFFLIIAGCFYAYLTLPKWAQIYCKLLHHSRLCSAKMCLCEQNNIEMAFNSISDGTLSYGWEGNHRWSLSQVASATAAFLWPELQYSISALGGSGWLLNFLLNVLYIVLKSHVVDMELTYRLSLNPHNTKYIVFD